jgi:hypothetical protein
VKDGFADCKGITYYFIYRIVQLKCQINQYIVTLFRSHDDTFISLDKDECFEGTYNCSDDEECDNIAGTYRCLCSRKLNMVRVNGTCQCK